MTLQAEAYNLGEVLVKSTDRDPAYAIIQQAQQWRAYHRREVASYRARIYIKALGRINDTPGKILGLFKLGPDIKPGIFYLSESLSDFSFTQPNMVKERMISSRVSGDSRGISFNRASAGRNLSFYDNLIKPGFSERGFVSPIAGQRHAVLQVRAGGQHPAGRRAGAQNPGDAAPPDRPRFFGLHLHRGRLLAHSLRRFEPRQRRPARLRRQAAPLPSSTRPRRATPTSGSFSRSR